MKHAKELQEKYRFLIIDVFFTSKRPIDRLSIDNNTRNWAVFKTGPLMYQVIGKHENVADQSIRSYDVRPLLLNRIVESLGLATVCVDLIGLMTLDSIVLFKGL